MDLSPFLRINPCGYAGLTMTQMSALVEPEQDSSCKLTEVGERLQSIFIGRLGYESTRTTEQLF